MLSVRRMSMIAVLAGLLAGGAVACSQGAPANDEAAGGAAAPAPEAQAGEEPGTRLSALAPANLAKERPAAPFDLTGNWFVDLSGGSDAWRFGPPYPQLTPAAQKEFDASRAATAEGKVYKDDIGLCYPAGLPLIMTRVWPIAMIQLPTAVYMVSGFMNSLRIVYLDGRPHSDPDVVVRSFNGESIGHWEGDTMVVDTTHFVADHHWMDQGGVAIPAGDKLHIVERIRLINDGNQLEIEYTMTDPDNWEGEWKNTKRFNRVDDVDITEVECLPDLNAHLPSTTAAVQVR